MEVFIPPIIIKHQHLVINLDLGSYFIHNVLDLFMTYIYKNIK